MHTAQCYYKSFMLKDEKRDERICQSFLLLHAVILITWWDSCLLSPLPPLLMSLLLLSSAIRKWRFRPCQKDSNLRTKSWQRAAAHHAMRRERVFMSKGFFFAWRGAFRVYKSKYYFFLHWRGGKGCHLQYSQLKIVHSVGRIQMMSHWNSHAKKLHCCNI